MVNHPSTILAQQGLTSGIERDPVFFFFFFFFFFIFLKDPRAGLVNAIILQIFHFVLITITLLVNTILRQEFFILFYFYKI